MRKPPLHRIIFILFLLAFAIGCKKEYEVFDESKKVIAGIYAGKTRKAFQTQSGGAQAVIHSDITFQDTIWINKINNESIKIKFVGDKVFTTFSDDLFDYRFAYSSWTFFRAKFSGYDSLEISGQEGNGNSGHHQLTRYEFKGTKL